MKQKAQKNITNYDTGERRERKFLLTFGFKELEKKESLWKPSIVFRGGHVMLLVVGVIHQRTARPCKVDSMMIASKPWPDALFFLTVKHEELCFSATDRTSMPKMGSY
jgi:hypothetical protein